MKQEKVTKWLLNKGFEEIESRSGKYRKFINPKSEITDVFYFVGKKGAVRRGRNISDSISVTNVIQNIMETETKFSVVIK